MKWKWINIFLNTFETQWKMEHKFNLFYIFLNLLKVSFPCRSLVHVNRAQQQYCIPRWKHLDGIWIKTIKIFLHIYEYKKTSSSVGEWVSEWEGERDGKKFSKESKWKTHINKEFRIGEKKVFFSEKTVIYVFIFDTRKCQFFFFFLLSFLTHLAALEFLFDVTRTWVLFHNKMAF